MAASVRVAQGLAASSLGIAAFLTYTNPVKGFNITRFLNLFQAGQYLMPGLIHTFKEDGGILSIGAGLGYTFNGPVKREDHRLVLIASKWGSAKLLSAFFLYYLEMHNNGEHSTIGTLFVLIENLIQYVIVGSILGKKVGMDKSKAPGRFRDIGMLVFGAIILFLNRKRDATRSNSLMSEILKRRQLIKGGGDPGW